MAAGRRFAYSPPTMFGLGFSELLIILVIVLIIFGAGRLPELGEGLGRGIKNFRKGVKPDEIDVTPRDDNSQEGDRRSVPPKPPGS
ncbi:MAG TPA: twin-arginine translocase TatA/TatE family subunit [Candidatus Limnocylindrales bacterium]|nr:twin-arginine translocase TatA/TatE family subunit [Candidatus Limnocylindrales bacterium]